MRRELIFSTMNHSPDMIERLGEFFNRFSRQTGADVLIQEMDYTSGWSDFIRMAIYGNKGPDVSEIGTTWIRDFITMNALRPYTPGDIYQVGGENLFLPNVWASGVDSEGVWAIPWLTDLRLVFYRRSALEKAGVDPQAAFNTSQHFETTVQALQDAGIENPLTLPVQRSYMALHNLAMWVWQAGGSFMDETRKVVLLDQPETRAGITAYFRLYRYLTPATRNLGENQSNDLFLSGNAAIVISGPWIFRYLNNNPGLTADLGMAAPLSQSYLGGSGLIVWQRVKSVQAAIQLITLLSSREAQAVFSPIIGMLPARVDALETFPLPDPSFYPVVEQTLRTGRTLPVMSLWGLVEDRLVTAMAAIGADLLDHPPEMLDEILEVEIPRLTQRLNMVLSQH